jgi:hypothetical protein
MGRSEGTLEGHPSADLAIPGLPHFGDTSATETRYQQEFREPVVGELNDTPGLLWNLRARGEGGQGEVFPGKVGEQKFKRLRLDPSSLGQEFEEGAPLAQGFLQLSFGQEASTDGRPAQGSIALTSKNPLETRTMTPGGLIQRSRSEELS